MKIVTQIGDLGRVYSKTAIALGTFDGIHIGHQRIIRSAVELARVAGGSSVVFTFSNHPLSIVAPERCPPFLLTQEDKARLIEELGVDLLVSIPFTATFLKLSPHEFVTLLVKHLSPVHIVVGPNYTFGYKSAGTPETLKEIGAKAGFSVQIEQAVCIDDKLVSSTYIRSLIAAGKVAEARKFLGRPPLLSGEVVHGEARGRILGYPTANIKTAEGMLLPADGVYAVRLLVGDIYYDGVANVGRNPTFNGQHRRVEVFLFGFEGSLYGKTVTVTFWERLRGEMVFANADELKRQISQDIQMARTYHQAFPGV